MTKIKIEYLFEAFRFDFEKGDVFWRNRPESHFPSSSYAKRWNRRWAGRPALSNDNGRGYLCGVLTVDGEKHRLQRHRVIFAAWNGLWPPEHVDHWDGDILNNRPQNLRSVTNSQNMKNAKKSSANTSGITGVYWFKPAKCWTALISSEGKQVSLGYFRKKSDAAAARKDAEVKFGFSPRHGQ